MNITDKFDSDAFCYAAQAYPRRLKISSSLLSFSCCGCVGMLIAAGTRSED
jgi:hypothetical protein